MSKVMSLRLRVGTLVVVLSYVLIAVNANASILFHFVEENGTVTMTSSGTLDTTKMVLSTLNGGWLGVGTENNGVGDIDIMGGTSVGSTDVNYIFNAGTDSSAITNPDGPFVHDFFPTTIAVTGVKGFATYGGRDGSIRVAGIEMNSADIVGGLWMPDQVWTYFTGSTFAVLGLNPGSYAVSDSITGETITILIGDIPEPTTIVLASFGIVAFACSRRRSI